MIRRWLRKRTSPSPSVEAVEMRVELDADLRPRVERVVRERERLLTENNYTARIRALYLEGRA